MSWFVYWLAMEQIAEGDRYPTRTAARRIALGLAYGWLMRA